jgi:hypothetical protein
MGPNCQDHHLHISICQQIHNIYSNQKSEKTKVLQITQAEPVSYIKEHRYNGQNESVTSKNTNKMARIDAIAITV